MSVQLSRIWLLQKKLLDMGYHPYQLHSIIREIIGDKPLDSLEGEAAEELIENLEQYIVFAAKCRKTKI